MKKPKLNEYAQPIELKANTKREFFLIHGYTGGPTDFNGLPQYLNKKFNANVRIILLKGHGTKIEDLDKVTYQDLLNQIENELKKDLKKKRKIVIGGLSFGGEVALTLAAKYPVVGVFNIGIPLKLKFPFTPGILKIVARYKKVWKKRYKKSEKHLRRKSFYYREMHRNALIILPEAANDSIKNLEKIRCPVLTIHSKKESVADYRGVNILKERIKSVHEIVLFENKRHNPFYTEKRHEVSKKIAEFFEKNKVFEN